MGIATGHASGLIIVDVDPRNNGEDGLAALEHDHSPLPESGVVYTGGGGWHLYLRHPLARRVPNRRNIGGYPGIDLKADGGYVVAPPSKHPGTGREYAFDAVLDPQEIELAPCPAWLDDLAGEPTSRREYAATEWDGTLPDSAAMAIGCSPSAFARFHRDEDGLRDRSDSGIDYSLACKLAYRRLGGSDIEAAIRFSRKQARLPDRPQTYFKSTIEKALAGAKQFTRDRERRP